jgi:hypothetical protein
MVDSGPTAGMPEKYTGRIRELEAALDFLLSIPDVRNSLNSIVRVQGSVSASICSCAKCCRDTRGREVEALNPVSLLAPMPSRLLVTSSSTLRSDRLTNPRTRVKHVKVPLGRVLRPQPGNHIHW